MVKKSSTITFPTFKIGVKTQRNPTKRRPDTEKEGRAPCLVHVRLARVEDHRYHPCLHSITKNAAKCKQCKTPRVELSVLLESVRWSGQVRSGVSR